MTSLTKSHDGTANKKDELFCLDYLTHFDAGKAWLSVSPKGKKETAAKNGWRWLQKPAVRKLLQKMAAEKIQKANVQAERLIEELERIAFLDPAEFMEVDSEGQPVLDLTTITPENRRLLQIEFGIGVSKDGDRIRTYKVKAHDKMEAVEKLLKLHQLYKGEDLQKQPMAIQVNVNFPLPGQQWRDNQANQPDVIDSEDL
ncbi:MAG: terminase small subunit [Alphaproteobacteria bacterium]|jgi:phage terminase small subunit|nr:terminase small subunit [Alphaproteobacteria bacterium]